MNEGYYLSPRAGVRLTTSRTLPKTMRQKGATVTAPEACTLPFRSRPTTPDPHHLFAPDSIHDNVLNCSPIPMANTPPPERRYPDYTLDMQPKKLAIPSRIEEALRSMRVQDSRTKYPVPSNKGKTRSVSRKPWLGLYVLFIRTQ
jgi:hypothetical protein